MKKLLVFAVAILGFSAFSFGQNSADQVAKAFVVQAITITSGIQLDFGTFASRNLVSSTVVMDVTGSRTGSTANLMTTGPGAVGTFDLTGDVTAPITIGLPQGVTSLTGPANAVPMTIASADWTTDGGSLGSYVIGTGGARTLKVGATLTVNANQTPGAYTGTYTVTANYN